MVSLAQESQDWINHAVASCGALPHSIRSDSPVFQDWVQKTLHQWKKATKHASRTFSEDRIIPSSNILSPEGLQESWIHSSIKYHIETKMKHHVVYGPFLCGPKIVKLHLSFDINDDISTAMIRKIIRKIITWFFFITPYATRSCNNDSLNVYVYMTPFQKRLQNKTNKSVEPLHCNSGLSDVCGSRSSSEIIVFRAEEWFKVLIHETFHNFGLDFSSHDNGSYIPSFHKRFGIPDSEYMLCETYTDMWARLLHVSYVAFEQYKQSNDKTATYSHHVEFLLFYESLFSIIQASHILSYFGIRYSDLPDKGGKFNETTNVFSYYICTALWMTDPISFIEWCEGMNHMGSFYQSVPSSQSYIRQFAHQLLMRSKRKSIHKRFEEAQRSCQWKNTLLMSIIDLGKLV